MSSDDLKPSTSGCKRTNVLTVGELRAMWNIGKIFHTFDTVEKCLAFAEEEGLIPRSRLCRTHRTPMALTVGQRNQIGVFRCRKGVCRTKPAVSRGNGTWFENIKIPLPQVFYLMFCYASHWTHAEVRKSSLIREPILSSSTISDWYNCCREAVVLYQVDQQVAVGKIGGPGKTVQIDVSKFGKRKNNKGRRVEGHWVLGMVEDGSDDLRLEVCPDNVRSADVLIPLIKKHVAEGSIICTDYWKAYDCLPNHGYVHRRVNHSDPDNPFVAEDGTHTQRIESQWRVIKRFFIRDNYNNSEDFSNLIVEYMWRKNIANQHQDPFRKLLEAIKYTYTP